MKKIFNVFYYTLCTIISSVVCYFCVYFSVRKTCLVMDIEYGVFGIVVTVLLTIPLVIFACLPSCYKLKKKFESTK